MPDRRTLVVGTTPDYIAYIYRQYPGRTLFLTDTSQREGSTEVRPDEASEIVYRLLDYEGVVKALEEHLKVKNQSLGGITCYDCEWLSLAARLATHFGLSFPPLQSIRLSRDKFLSKKRWTDSGVRCPRVQLVPTGWHALRLFDSLSVPVVLKPPMGSGSELTFKCRDRYDLTTAFRMIKTGLAQRGQLPMYHINSAGAGDCPPDQPVLAEEYIDGREYSADFIIDDDDVTLVRVAKKLRCDALSFGTTVAYLVPARLPGRIRNEELEVTLRRAAQALGITRAICMVDFIISDESIVLLELTPRIGGDCLPPLIRKCCGLDTIGLALDFAECRKYAIPERSLWKEHVGMRFFANQGGVLAGVNCEKLAEDPSVKEIFIKRAPGHEITLPPEDYDSWLLGHVIFEPHPDICLIRQCDDLREKIIINVEKYHDSRFAWFRSPGCRAAQSTGPAA